MRLPVLALAAACAAAPAAAFTASNGLLVQPSGAGGFDVAYRGPSGAPEFWCAAGEYVLQGLGMAPGTRLYRASAPPRRSGEGIAFSLDAAAATEPGIVLLGSPDRGMSAAMAESLCRGARFPVLRVE